MRLCLECLSPYDDVAAEPRQLCSCRSTGQNRIWPDYDYNEHTHLCECCLGRRLRSGSRWSVWFCEPCKRRVIAVNRELGATVIPIGRHSLMSGVGLHGPEIDEPRVARFTKDLLSLFSRQDHLHEWSRARLERLVAATSPWESDPDLDEFLAAARAAGESDHELSPTGSFVALCAHFGIELADIPDG